MSIIQLLLLRISMRDFKRGACPSVSHDPMRISLCLARVKATLMRRQSLRSAPVCIINTMGWHSVWKVLQIRDNLGTGWVCQVHGLSKKIRGRIFWDGNSFSFQLYTYSDSILCVHTVLTFPLELLLVHETIMHSLSLPWYLSTVFTSTLEQQLTPLLVASPWQRWPFPPASAFTGWSSPLPSQQKEGPKELFCLSACWSFSRMRFCCCLRGVMTPISPPSKPNCSK